MVDFCRVLEISNEICDSVTHKGEHIHARCPICGDSAKARKKRLHIDWYDRYQSWVATCYNGGCSFRSGDIYSLYAQATGMEYREAKRYVNNDIYDSENIKTKLKPVKIVIDHIIEPIQDFDLDFDSECLTIDSIPDGRIQERLINSLQEFIIKRCMGDTKLYVAYKGKYQGRIIIPVIIDNKIMYYQGRSISDHLEPKYLNPVVDKEGIMMNSDNFNKDNFIILTEGIIDAYMVDYNQGCPFLGSYVNDTFIESLMDKTDKGIIIAWDNPYIDKAAELEIIKFINESKYSKILTYFLPKRKDFKDLNDIKMMSPDLNIYDYVVDNSFSYINILTKLKLK